jgi:ABC-type thiamin/hydroxymethylpyrimidine transport system permease subunit/DMSO/TMAO reductase YedYZ molybdopterin-dependent catalytic subunit
MDQKRTYFTTRDLLLMAALAALGGVASTYINAVGDVIQSALGFSGGFQWAAGLHVLWLVLAVGLTGKLGAGTVTGLLKGGVELLTGNTHGLLVLLVDLVAGLLVDLGFLPFRHRNSLLAYAVAGGLASASNVFVFQLFASLPADVLAYGALLLLAGVAFLSGVVLAGGLGYVLTGALRRAGVVKDQPPLPARQRFLPIFLVGAVLLTAAFALFLRGALSGPAVVHIGGAVESAYDYPSENGDIAATTAEATLQNVTRRYTGVPLKELLARARPEARAALVLVQASDGYSFFVAMDEVAENPNLLLVATGKGKDASYDLQGPRNQKAWVREVSEIAVMGPSTLPITGTLASPAPFNPDDWQFEMDSTGLDVGQGPRKLQGAPLGKVLQTMQPNSEATTVLLQTGGDPVTLSLEDVLGDDSVRIFTIIDPAAVSFAVARMDGQVLAPSVTGIEVR